jgi:methyl-accepting chemotaxis protein
MFKSIKFKLITLFVVLFIVTLFSVGFYVNYQTTRQIEKDVVSQTEGIVGGLENSIHLFLEKHSVSLEQIAASNTAALYLSEALKNGDQANQSRSRDLEKDFENYLNLYNDVSSIYIATANKKLKIVPYADLPDDFDPTTRDWYKEAYANPNEVIWSEPYVDTATKDTIVTASKAIQSGSEVIGVVGIDIRLTNITNMVKDVKINHNGFPFILSKNGIAIVHPTKRTKNLMEWPFIKEMYESKKKSGNIEYVLDGDDKLLVFDTVSETEWKVGAAYSFKDLMVSAEKIQFNLFIISIIALTLAIVITYFVAKSVTNPILNLKETVDKVATGDLRVKANVKTKDELGQLGQNFNQMIESMKGILTIVNKSVENVKESAESLSAVSEETNAASEEMAVAINEIAQGASQSAAEADAANQRSIYLSKLINDVTAKAEQMTQLADSADDVNKAGITQVRNLKESFQVSRGFIASMEKVIYDLEEKVEKIETVMKTITDISSQTNLLALNASIEAARAGEHGKGFAVVAEEVRKLAEQSVSATDEVRQTIADIQSGSIKAVEEINKTIATFEKQADVVSETEAAFDTISEVVEKMKQSILSIHKEIDSITESKEEVVSAIQSMAAVAEQAAASCEEVSASTDEQLRALQSVADSAEHLSELSNELKGVVQKFRID